MGALAQRRVVLLCGPPGAGKTTWARESGLTVYDRDDPQWEAGGEINFRAAIAELKHDPSAGAVVIRSGATNKARRWAADLIGATEVRIVDTPYALCVHRIKTRRRLKQDIRTQIASARSWWSTYEPASTVDVATPDTIAAHRWAL